MGDGAGYMLKGPPSRISSVIKKVIATEIMLREPADEATDPRAHIIAGVHIPRGALTSNGPSYALGDGWTMTIWPPEMFLPGMGKGIMLSADTPNLGAYFVPAEAIRFIKVLTEIIFNE